MYIWSSIFGDSSFFCKYHKSWPIYFHFIYVDLQHASGTLSSRYSKTFIQKNLFQKQFLLHHFIAPQKDHKTLSAAKNGPECSTIMIALTCIARLSWQRTRNASYIHELKECLRFMKWMSAKGVSCMLFRCCWLLGIPSCRTIAFFHLMLRLSGVKKRKTKGEEESKKREA